MRWKGFITLGVLLVFFIGGTVLFAPRIIHSSIEKAGTAIWGAKVEADEVNLSLSPFGIEVRGFTVASRNEEYKNLFETESIRFSLITAALLERKININEMSGTGLAFGTERTSSGFIPRKKREEDEDRMKIYRQHLIRWLSQIKDRAVDRIDIPEIRAEDLKSYERYIEARGELEGLKEKAEKLKAKDAGPVSQRVQSGVEDIRRLNINTREDIAVARQKIEELRQAIQEAEEFAENTRVSISEFNSDVSSVLEIRKEIDEARRTDYRLIMDKLQLPSLDTSDIAETIFGPVVMGRFTRFVGYVDTVRKYIPPRKEKKRAARPPRFKGEDIVFFREKMHPPFLIAKAYLAGAGGEYVQIENLSWSPHMHEEPASVEVLGGNFELSAVFDRREEMPRDTIDVSYRGFNIGEASGDLHMEAEFLSEELNSELSWKGRGLLPSEWTDYIGLGDPDIEIKAQVSGKRNSPDFKISSNLDRIISERLKEEMGAQVQEATEQVRKIIDQKIVSRAEEITAEVYELRSETLAKVEKERDLALQRKREAEREIDNKRKEIEKALAEETSDVQERIEDGLRDIFR